MKRTRDALIARGLDSGKADDLTASGHTLQKLQLWTDAELSAAGLTSEEIDRLRKGDRPPIPADTLHALLFANRFQCCVCRNPDRPFIVHHIKPWAASRSHAIDNLAVLCLEHHDAAHSTSTLRQDLTESAVADHKARWEAEVKRLDARSIVDAMGSDGSQWAYINELRLFETVRDLHLDVSGSAYYASARSAGLIDEAGVPLPVRTDTFYKYEGSNINSRYFYMKEVLERTIEHLPIINISDFFDRDVILPSIWPGDFVFTQGAHVFSRLNKRDYGMGQHCRGVRSANNVEVRFTFDRWEATSSSSLNDWLVGTRRAGSLVQVKDLERDGKRVILTGTVLGITSFTPELKNRDYDASWTCWTPRRRRARRPQVTRL